MEIVGYDDEKIQFTDGSTITFDHDQDCCEHNYADFSVLDVFYHGERFTDYRVTHDNGGFILVLEGVPRRDDLDLKVGFGYEMRIFIPCYSEQNGYYSDQIDIYINNKSRVKCLSMQARLDD